MYLGRIITKSKNLKTLDFVCKREEYTEDKNLPTLIVGKENAKAILGDSLSFVDRKASDVLSWTFLKTENRQYFENDLAAFNNEIIDRIKENFKYIPFDLFTAKFSEIKRLISFFKNVTKKYIYIGEKEIYVYSQSNAENKTVFGISLDEAEYIGVNRDKIINGIKSNKNCFVVENGDFLSRETKSYFSNISIYLPYLYFLMSE